MTTNELTEGPRAQGEPVADGWKLVPAKATRDWAYDLATYRQGRSSTPRCEGPTQADVAWGMDRIGEILAVAPEAPVLAGQGKPVAWLYEREYGQHWHLQVAITRPLDGPRVRDIEPLFKQASAAPRTGSRATHKIIEAADCIGVRGADWALTIEWPDGAETVEHVSDHVARVLGYEVPNDD